MIKMMNLKLCQSEMNQILYIHRKESIDITKGCDEEFESETCKIDNIENVERKEDIGKN